MTLVNIDEYRAHTARYVACMECAHDWTAVAPSNTGSLECPSCGAMAGEAVRTGDLSWFKRFIDRTDLSSDQIRRRTVVLLNARRMGL